MYHFLLPLQICKVIKNYYIIHMPYFPDTINHSLPSHHQLELGFWKNLSSFNQKEGNRKNQLNVKCSKLWHQKNRQSCFQQRNLVTNKNYLRKHRLFPVTHIDALSGTLVSPVMNSTVAKKTKGIFLTEWEARREHHTQQICLG